MRYTLTVVVPADQETRLLDYVNEVMEVFSEHNRVPPYREYFDAEGLAGMAAAFGTDDRAALASHVQEWVGMPGGVDGRGVYAVTTWNANAKWDWWVVGGRYRGWFKVKPNMPYVLGEKSFEESEPPAEGFGDIVQQGDVDWEGPPETYASYALITKERTWLERGMMPRPEWAKQWMDYVGSQSWDDYLVLIDYHT